FAPTTGEVYHAYYACNKIVEKVLTGEEKECMARVWMRESKEALGKLPLLPRMPVMITENLAIGKRVVNRSEGILKQLVYKDVDGKREAVCAYMEIENCTL
ncbi:hypothetical protein BDN67DRAFT_865126, partial [Paxillus ammoniavirescens]